MLIVKQISTGMLAVLATATVAGAAQFDQPQQNQPKQPQQLQQQPLQQQKPEETVVAKVNNDTITETELKTQLQSRLRGQQADPKQMEQLQQQVLNDLIESRLVEQYVLKEGPGAEREEVEATLERLQKQLESQGLSFKQFLASRGQTEDQFRKRVAGSLAWRKYQQEQLKPDELQKFYEENQDEFGGANFQEAQEEVIQAYSGKLWNDIIKETKQEAEIKIVKPQDSPSEKPKLPQQLPQP